MSKLILEWPAVVYKMLRNYVILSCDRGSGGPPGDHPTQGPPEDHLHPLEKSFYQILMKTMEMDSKYERFFRRIRLGMNERNSCASRGLGEATLTTPPPPTPLKLILPDFDEEDGDGRQR